MSGDSYTIKSKLFSVECISEYKLIVKCLKTSVKLAVIDTVEKSCLYYENHELLDPKNQIESMFTFWDNHSFLTAQYWKCVQIISNQSTVSFIPKAYENEKYYPYFLKLNGAKLTAKNIYIFEHKTFDLINIFNLDPAYKTFFREQIYPQADLSFLHNSSIFLENLATLTAPSENPNIYLNISENLMTAVIFQGEKLFFINSYFYSQTIDIIYFTNLLIEYFNLANNKIKLILWGDIALDQEDFLKKHLPNFNFGKRHPDSKLEDKFDSLPTHMDFDMLI